MPGEQSMPRTLPEVPVHSAPARGILELEGGESFPGTFFGGVHACHGEVVFNTGMVGYVESLTDPSYRGQILTLTYPLIGNYGVASFAPTSSCFQSDGIQVRALIVSSYTETHSHRDGELSLGDWLRAEGIVGLAGVDTRELTRLLRNRGTMLGRIRITDARPGLVDDAGVARHAITAAACEHRSAIPDPNATHLVAEVSTRDVRYDPHPAAEDEDPARNTACLPGPHIVVVDCGCKRSILRELRERGCRLTIVPHDHDLCAIPCDGMLLSNGPGDPVLCEATVRQVAARLAEVERLDVDDRPPLAGICLGNQLLARAAGARTYKLPYGHRGQNQPVRRIGSQRCYITSQNHGYAVDGDSLPEGWEVWYENLNDGTVEGIRHSRLPFFAVQFHPEGAPGPLDARDFFDAFLSAARRAQQRRQSTGAGAAGAAAGSAAGSEALREAARP
ncbi:MAG: glutamine-hydrolyzing carbamoyl-phosphate synthase small subunit [Candidatus Eisenbacteria bacterium]|nr:glutamine-hydrolyzing carbamoyl-phosphate synthase small subunit [Candidatus Eisenbacteria bacterium]